MRERGCWLEQLDEILELATRGKGVKPDPVWVRPVATKQESSLDDTNKSEDDRLHEESIRHVQPKEHRPGKSAHHRRNPPSFPGSMHDPAANY